MIVIPEAVRNDITSRLSSSLLSQQASVIPNDVLSTESASVMSKDNARFLPDYIRLISNIFYPTILSIGLIGNIMVILVIFKMKDMRSSTNIFLANLAIADLMVLIVWGSTSLVDNNSDWGILSLSEDMCTALIFIMEAVPSASVLTILAISFERYYAICQPLRAGYYCTRNRAYKICLLTWPVAALFSSPHLFMGYHNEQYREGGYVETICQQSTDSYWSKAYYIASPLLFYILPLVMLMVLYLAISRRLRGPVAMNGHTYAIRHRRRVVSMLAAVVVAFFVCLLPVRIFYILYVFGSTELVVWMGIQWYNIFWFVALVMLYLHSIVNPILYNVMSKRFRLCFKNISSDIKFRGGRRFGIYTINNTITEMSISSS